MAAEPIPIRELQREVGTSPLEATLHVQLDQKASKETRQGKAYIELNFTDGLDPLTLRVWGDHPRFTDAQNLEAGAFVSLKGQWVDRGQFGIEPLSWTLTALDATQQEALLRGPKALREKQALDWRYLQTTIDGLTDPRLRALGTRFLEQYEDRLMRTAAARRNHHARRGGLVEHVAQMMRSAAALLGVYPELNADLVLCGVLFHDCGKLWENSYQSNGFTMPYREIGELLGHIPLGIELINHLWRDLEASPEAAAWSSLDPKSEDVRLHLLHLVASHHGTHEFGSPVLPKTPEAVLLHFVDNIDAKLEMYKEGYETSPLLGKNVFERRRPLFHPLVRPLPRCQEEAPQDASVASDEDEETPASRS